MSAIVPPRQVHNPVSDDTSWWCPDCRDSAQGFPDAAAAGEAADGHVVAAFEVDAALRGLAQASDEDERV